MENVAVTIHVKHKNGEESIQKDVLLPLDVPQYYFLETLAEALKITVPKNYQLQLAHPTIGKIPVQQTLRRAGICHGEFVQLTQYEIIADAYLLCTQNPLVPLRFPLNKEVTIIGCGYGKKKVDIDLTGIPNNEYVSNKHAKIFKESNKYFLQDLDSKNGTKINDKVIQPQEKYLLEPNSRILLGNFKDYGIPLVFKIRQSNN